MSTLLRWAKALLRHMWDEGSWVYAPPMIIPGSSPIWRMAPPTRIDPAPEPDPAPETARTDPQVVAARRAGFRLILNESKA